MTFVKIKDFTKFKEDGLPPGTGMSPPLSPAEGMTPDDVFARNFSTERTEAKATPEGKAIKEAWEEYKGTSYALSKVFLGDTKFEPPNPENREAVAQYNALPEWAKSKDGRGIQWGSQEMEDTFNEFLGITMLPGETAMGFLDQQGLRPSEGETGTNFDAATETLAKLARDYKTKGEFRRALAAMAKDEVKSTLSDLVTRKANADIQARRIDKRTMLKIAQTPALVDKLVNEPKLNTVQRLVSRDDMQPGIVVRQGDNLYAVRSIAPDRVPEMVNLRGGRAFDYTEVAVDDPMNDPGMARDYRFGMELPPVVPYYGVQAAFPASASVEVQDMIDDLPAEEGQVPFSAAEGMDGFYSPLARTIEAKMPKSAPLAQAKSIVTTNTKAEEVKWTGIVPKMEEMAAANGGKVDKAALLTWLAGEGAVKFEEAGNTRPGTYRVVPEKADDGTEGFGLYNGDEFIEWYETRSEAEANMATAERATENTLFSEYTLPGGEKYREVVLTLPTAPEFISSHFPGIPNYVAHMRLDEREGGLFIEELQSDRHQQGREKGYEGDVSAAQAAEWRAEHRRLDDLIHGPADALAAEGGYAAVNGARLALADRIVAFDSTLPIPDAPYRKDWPLALFKRALRDAVAAGKKWIGWTTGETQAERYDLSTKVAAINYWDTGDGDGSFGLHIEAMGGGPRVFEDDAVSAQRVADIVGKEVLARMQAGEGEDIGNDVKSLTGDNLKIGGEGMKGFYDNILPKEIGKYVKQWGATVEKGAIADDTAIWKVEITPAMAESVAQGQPLFSPAEGMTPIDSFLAPKGSLMRETYNMKAKAAEAHRILNSNGASTFAQKAANLSKADTAEAGVAGFARQILMQESMEMLANPDQGRRERFFGTSDEELMKAKAIEIADERHIFYSETGVELVSAQFDENGNHLPPTEQRRFGDWMEWISHTFGMAGLRDVKKMNLTKEKVEKADAVRDAMDDLIADLANLPKAEFEPALQSRVARIREAAFRAQIARVKAGAPLSAAEAGEGDIAARVFADPGVYYRRLKGKTGAAFRDEIERTYGPGSADLMAEQLEAHIAMFPDLAGKPKRAPTVTEEAEIDLINEMLKGHEKKLEALKVGIYTGEVGQFITENFRARLPQLNLRLAALSASMTPEEQGAEIDKAFREIAKTILEEKKKERGGAALVQQGLLSVEGIEASLAEAKEAVKARQVAFTAIAPAVNMALRNASVSIADLLKVSQQKVGRIQFNLGQQIAGKVTEELVKMPELAEFPDAIDAAAQKVADSVEAYIAKRLEDSVDTIGNESMATWNKIDRVARGLPKPLLDLFYGPTQGPKPYAETAKGTAAALLAEPALFRARVEAALAEQKAKGDLLENDVLGEMARGLGLPANATWDQIATTLTAKPIPDALARRVIAEHMAQTGGSILELADVLNPTADSAFERVVDDLTREFGEGTRALWRDALTKQVEARRAIIAKRILSKRKAKGQKVNAYDKMIRAIAGGMFDDETMALALAESVGLPELTQETRDALRPLLAAEVAALRAYGPDDPITHRATDAISGLLARELIKSWPKKGWFTKLDEQRLKSAFYSGALSGFRTWAITNPASSWSKTFQTILETAAKNALLDPVLKKQGLQGVAAALSHMIRTMSLDASRLALREGIAPRSIERGPYLDAKVPESGLWDTDANASVVHKTLFSMWGLAAKYVRRAIMAGDASPYQSGFSFGSYEAARKIVLMEAEAAGETLSLAETQRRVYDKLALGPDGKPTAAQMEQAKAELDRSGSTYSDAEVRLRAESIARRSRPDYVNAAGRFLGEQGTFTNDVGVHYAQVEGMPGEPGLGQRLLNWVNSAKNSANPAVALLATAVVPFPGIASRILDQSINYLALPGYFRWRALNGLAETAETPAHRAAYAEAAGLQMVRMVEGTIALAVMALLVAMQDEDDPWLQITGAGPADFRKNYQWREAGNRPMTVKLGEAQVDYRWSPLASLLFAVGTWQDQKLEDPDDRKGLVTAAARGFMTSTFNQSFMSSVADLLDVISGRDEQGAQQKLFSLLGNPVSSIVVPFSGAVRTVEQAFFPYPNAARVEDNFFKTFAKTTIARIPIMNELLPRKMNALGRAIETDRPFEADVSWKGWRRGGDEDANKVFDYVVEKQAWLPTPNALRTHVLPPESDMTKGEARRLADKDDALMTYAEYEKFMQRRGDIAIALFQKHEALLRTLPEGEAAREVMSELMSLASTQAKREAVGLRPFKPGVQPDRVIRAAVKRAAAEN